ncbi:MAG: spore maturation protein CgeB/tetratricopeptide (TPR) repeat protein [Nitrospinales bacterium]|jgi:spore maturation protein CgeB/tetratricopeptide (TPR) repeat protein
MKLKILTFNWHEPYLCLLSRMNHEFLVVEPEIAPDHYRKWDQNMRPVPVNVRLISIEQALKDLDQGEIDCIIAHNVKDLIKVRDYTLPKIMVFHNCLTTEIKLGNNKINRNDYLQKITPLFDGVTKVFISEMKKADWEMQGEVILPGLDVSEYGGYTGNEEKVLRVGNLLKERDLMMGYSFGEKIIKNHPLITLGMNPGIPESRISNGFDDLLKQFQNNRVYINTTVDGFEDGYNLSMLEAMATGMPIVTSQNKTSPICDGINGFSSNDPEYLNSCIGNLMKDPVLAKEMGDNARETVAEKFPINRFIQSWSKGVELAINDFLKRTGIDLQGDTVPFGGKSRKNILMDFVSYPATTAHYLERALRQNHNVMTCGAQINDEIKKCWDLEALNWEVTPQDIPRGNATPLKQVLDQLPQGWKPDFYFWLETGLSGIPIDLHEYDLPKVCYLIDSHINYEKHVDIASNFDFIFLAQKAYVEKMTNAGIKNVFWLPLACDPDIHGKVEQEKKWDVGFVGTIPEAQNRRKILLERIGSRFNLSCERKFMDEMAEHYSRSKIVFNNAINNDLNMRVFEALCSGSLLVTDCASGSGLEEMFENRKHLIIYNDENIESLIADYLVNDKDRELIAEKGRQEVLKNHTYAHRADDLLNVLNREIGGHNKESNDIDKPENYYKNIRHDLIPLVPEDASCILEVGCAEGMTGNELKKRPGVFVAGIENNEIAAEMARKVLDDVIAGDIECMDIPYSPSAFDCIIFADVLEHLVNPLDVLKKVSKLLKKDGTIIMSIPNVQFYGVVNQLIEGNWTYQKEGILDETHLRFFTFKEIEKLVKEAGLSIQQVEETLDPQYEKFSNDNHTALKFGRLSIDGLTPEEIRRFFVFQYKIVAGKAMVDIHNETTDGNMVMKNLLTEALNHFDKAEYEAAIGKYEEALVVDSNSPEALVGIGNCCMRLQNPKKAESNFIKAKTYDAGCHKAWLGLGLLELYKENTKQSEIYLRKSIELNPENDKAFCALGILKTNTNDLKAAEEYFCRALDANIDNLLAIKSIIEISYKTEKFDKAYSYLKRFLEFYPANINMLFAMAGIEFKKGEIEESLQTLDAVLILDPKHQYALDFQNSVRMVSAE